MYLKGYIDAKRVLPYCGSDNFESTLDDIDEYRCYAIDEKRTAKLYERLSQYKCPVCGSDLVIDDEDYTDSIFSDSYYYCHCDKCEFNAYGDVLGDTEEEAVDAIIKHLENTEKL